MTTEQRPSEGVQLSPEDRQRMTRLREETVARLTEMGLIVARALDQEPKLVTAVNIEGQQGAAERTSVTVIFGGPGKPNTCYVDPPGICSIC